MSSRDFTMSWSGEGSDCVSYRLRRAGRLAAKFYDDALRPCGLRNTQFTLLSALDHLGEISIGDLSYELAIDGTTLTRNLDVLVRRRLILNGADEDGRVRTVRLSAAGERTIDKAMPLWRKAQRKMLKAIGGSAWGDMRAYLDEIEAVCEPHL
jgi:DNA-binding MarR family transcriptional regulator